MSRDMDERRGRHVVSALHVHLVFVTTHRRGVLPEEPHRLRADVVRTGWGDVAARVVEGTGEDDHVPLRVDSPPTAALPVLVTSLTGVSARRLRQQDRIRTHRGRLGSSSNVAASGGGAPLSTIRRDIEQQRMPV